MISPLRVLLLDDEPLIHENARKRIIQRHCADEVIMYDALTNTEAASIYRDHFIDLAIIDILDANGSRGGLELLRYLHTLRASCGVTFITHVDHEVRIDSLVRVMLLAREPKVVEFIDKRDDPDYVWSAIRPHLERRQRMPIQIRNEGLATQMIASRRKRGYAEAGLLPLRNSPEEIAVEVERVTEDLFDTSVWRTSGVTRVDIAFAELPRAGLSAAATLQAHLSIQMSDLVSAAPPYTGVVKIGPRNEIMSEVARFNAFVRFGVPFEERVELQAWSERDSLAAILYSLAGGTTGPLTSLDDLIREGSPHAVTVIGRLYSTTVWYGVDAGVESPLTYFLREYRVDFVEASRNADVALRALAKKKNFKLREGERGGIELTPNGGSRLTLPGSDFTGRAAFSSTYPWCLVHGDMHGGNVMVESSQGGGEHIGRVSLIDFRYAGPGPRCIDAAALSCSIRVADAESLASAESVDGDSLFRLVSRRIVDERKLLEECWGEQTGAVSEEDVWLAQAVAVVRGLHTAFRRDPPSVAEFAQTCALYCLRYLRYNVESHVRLRILAWLSALIEYS